MESLFTQFPEFESIDACWEIYEQDKRDEHWHYLDHFSAKEVLAMKEAKYAHEYAESYMRYSNRYCSASVFYDKNAAFKQMDKDQEPSNEDRYMMELNERVLDSYDYHHLDENSGSKEPLWKRQVDRITELLKKD